MLLLLNAKFKSAGCLYQHLYLNLQTHSYKLNFTYMFSTADVWTVFCFSMEMQKNSILCREWFFIVNQLLIVIPHYWSFKKSLRKESQKQMNNTHHSKIHHCPPQHCLHVLARDTKPGWQGLQGLSTLDMFPVRHQMKPRKGKSSLEFLSNFNATNINLKGNSYSYIPWPFLSGTWD